MRYTILKPSGPFDPRRAEYPSLDHLREKMPSTADCELESQAAEAVRELYPDAIAMPVPIRIGSGEMLLLGILACAQPVDLEGPIPFVGFVQAVPQHNMDQVAIKKRRQFNRTLWKAPVLAPRGDAHEVKVELRASDLEIPSRVVARMYRRADKRGGRPVLYLDLNGVEMSVEFLDSIPLELVH